jgi:predicted transcriptional regulator
MMLDITNQEREALLELLEERLIAMLHEINHTDARDYREILKRRYELVERIKSKLERLQPEA